MSACWIARVCAKKDLVVVGLLTPRPQKATHRPCRQDASQWRRCRARRESRAGQSCSPCARSAVEQAAAHPQHLRPPVSSAQLNESPKASATASWPVPRSTHGSASPMSPGLAPKSLKLPRPRSPYASPLPARAWLVSPARRGMWLAPPAFDAAIRDERARVVAPHGERSGQLRLAQVDEGERVAHLRGLDAVVYGAADAQLAVAVKPGGRQCHPVSARRKTVAHPQHLMRPLVSSAHVKYVPVARVDALRPVPSLTKGNASPISPCSSPSV